jgi:hypothetical protein
MVDLLRIKCNPSLVLLNHIVVVGSILKLGFSLLQLFEKTPIILLDPKQLVYLHPHLDYSLLVFLQSSQESTLILAQSPIGFTQIKYSSSEFLIFIY